MRRCARVLDDLRAEGVVNGHQLVAHHSVVMDPAYVHITRASLAEHRRLTRILNAHGVYPRAATAAGPTARSRTTSSRRARSSPRSSSGSRVCEPGSRGPRARGRAPFRHRWGADAGVFARLGLDCPRRATAGGSLSARVSLDLAETHP